MNKLRIMSRLLVARRIGAIRRKASASIFQASKLTRTDLILLLKFELGIRSIPCSKIYQLLKVYNASDEDVFYFCSLNEQSVMNGVQNNFVLNFLFRCLDIFEVVKNSVMVPVKNVLIGNFSKPVHAHSFNPRRLK